MSYIGGAAGGGPTVGIGMSVEVNPGRKVNTFRSARDGGRANRQFRKAWCRVTSRTDAPVPWPLGAAEGPYS